MDFLVNRDDLHDFRIEDSETPAIEDGQALLQIDCFGLTSNNITYAVFGDAMSYWDFFPTGREGWGHVPVWGFAEVTDPGDTELAGGARVYGYLPPSSHLLVTPDRVDERSFVDAAPHRAKLPSAYQGYRLPADPAYDAEREAEQILFWPLFYTSFLIDDFLADEEFFGAETMVLSSASSKTGLIAAYLLAQREGIELIGLTSPKNTGFVEGLGIYDAAVSYDEVGGLERDSAVYVDMSGDGNVRASVHGHFGDSLKHSCAVGATHWDQMAAGAGESLPGPPPTMFFAPDRIKQRGADWGSGDLDKRVIDAWKPFVEWAHGWLEVERGASPEALKQAYLEVLDGKVPPAVGHVISLQR